MLLLPERMLLLRVPASVLQPVSMLLLLLLLLLPHQLLLFAPLLLGSVLMLLGSR
jgi:hypothetical protein